MQRLLTGALAACALERDKSLVDALKKSVDVMYRVRVGQRIIGVLVTQDLDIAIREGRAALERVAEGK